MSFTHDLNQMIIEARSFDADLDQIIATLKTTGKKYGEVYRDFDADLDALAKERKCVRLLKRLYWVQNFDIKKYKVTGPEPFRILKRMDRKRAILEEIIKTYYWWVAFGWIDGFIPIGESDITFENIRKYYHQYTGTSDGPRSRHAQHERFRIELAKAKTFDEELEILAHFKSAGVNIYE